MKKQILVVFLILLSLTSVFANGGKEATVAPSATKELTGTLCSTEPKEFTMFLTFNNMPFNKDWPVWQKAAEMTNVSFVGTIPQSNSNEEEAFNLMLSSGKLADVIGYKTASVLDQLGRDDGLIALNDLIDKYAPHIKAYMEKDIAFKNACYSLDGNIYYIPKTLEVGVAETWWIRNDWLKKLNLKTPTTVDELYNVLYAFRNNDPNGNGLKDEVPLFDRAGWKMPDEYLYLWDTSTEFYTKDGKVIFEPLEENFKYGVKNIVKWYKEGLIDPEIFTRGPKSRDILMSGNLGGCTHDWASAGKYNTTLAEAIPGIEMLPIEPPADQNGKINERTMNYPLSGWGIASTCKDPETVIRFFDFCFSPEGEELMNWGIKGSTYEVDASGKKYVPTSVKESKGGVIGTLRSIGAAYRIGMVEIYNPDRNTDIENKSITMYMNHPEWFDKTQAPYFDGKLNLQYPAEVETEYQKLMSNIRPFVDEKFQSWMLGTSNFDTDYPEFVKELKKRGIDRAIEINQIAYDTYMKRN